VSSTAARTGFAEEWNRSARAWKNQPRLNPHCEWLAWYLGAKLAGKYFQGTLPDWWPDVRAHTLSIFRLVWVPETAEVSCLTGRGLNPGRHGAGRAEGRPSRSWLTHRSAGSSPATPSGRRG
jgi:hypothetical protein